MEEAEKDNLFRDIQSYFGADTVLVIGSGLSCAEGLPGMWKLAEKLVEKVPEQLNDQNNKQWLKIKEDLTHQDGSVKEHANLEATLLKYPPDLEVETIIRKVTADYIKREEQKVIEKVIKGEQELRFSTLIKKFNITDAGLKIVCTNYDRLLEIACEVENIPIDNLFYGKYIARLDSKKSRMSFCEKIDNTRKPPKMIFTKKVSIYKPHGCLNWYLYKGNPINSTFDLELERLIITPGVNKFRNGYETPFDTHRDKANNVIDRASKFLIVGYGFNDEHLETHLKQRIREGTPTLILTKFLSESSQSLIKDKENVIACYHYQESDSKIGTEIIYKNNIYRIHDLDLWDIKTMTEVVF